MSKSGTFAALMAAAALSCGAANAEPLFAFLTPPAQVQIAPQAVEPAPADEADDAKIDPRLKRQIVDYNGKEAAGTIIVDTPHTFLYYVLGNGKAMRYGIGVGREGFTWSGVGSIERKAEWPDWYPPAEMVARQPYLPRMTSGGPGNPLGARAMYIAGTQYRIHGTNAPTTIRQTRFERLHPPDQRRRDRSLQPRASRCESCRAAADCRCASQASVTDECLCATATGPRGSDLEWHPAFRPLLVSADLP